ncbi:MAG: hypothetical protein RIQ52_957 [Pseudomonadota bacterium]|jgi:[NiFe] hydrogenase diaphorase moiety large subunit
MTQNQTHHASYLEPVLNRYQHNPFHLLQILREAQESFGYIHPDAIDEIGRALQLPRASIEGVASFYSHLYLEPRGVYRILFSDNITDRMLGSEALLERLCQQLWVEPGKVSEDGLVSVDRTSCTGLCDQGPALLVNQMAVSRLTPDRIDSIAELVRTRVPVKDWPATFFAVDDHIHRRDILLRGDFVSGSAIARTLARGDLATLDEVKKSGLRGRGGAGFSTGMKWQFCREASGNQHYVVCNADEGEPGTFKDRVLLTSFADLVFEGMTVCARIIGAHEGFLYLRGEYRYLLPVLQQVLARRRQAGLLGCMIKGVAGFDFDISIHLGAGAYVCGEESALIESLEGKRGTPRNRPPFPVTHGYRDQPTVVNNVETFAASSLVALHGGDWYAAIGCPGSSGTKILSISGDCQRPGLYEYPFGITVAEVLADCGASDTQAVQISGPSGTCIASHEFARRIAFDDLPTAGSFMVFDSSRDLFEVARCFVHFFAHESCGFCTPCRVGTSLLRHLMDKLADGRGSLHDFDEIGRLNQLLLATSHCGLGHTACNPVLDTMGRFRDSYEKRLLHRHYEPAFDLDRSLAQARAVTGRDDPAAHLESVHATE